MTISSQIQLGLFSQPTLNVARDIKIAMNDDVKASALSRAQVVDRMNELADRHGVSLVHGNGKRLTIEAFEKWLNVDDLSRQIPVRAIPVFCAATGQHQVVNVLVMALGLRVIGDKEQKKLAWADAKLDVMRKSRMIRKLESDF